MSDASVGQHVEEAAGAAEAAADKGAAKLSATAEQVKKTVTEKAGVAKDWAGDRAGVARDWALDQGDVLRDTVQTRPFISVGVSAGSAFAAGLILGILLTRN
ncbi:MAG: hypothetical protein WA840_19635 [Caulobacteraceae bacterium]